MEAVQEPDRVPDYVDGIIADRMQAIAEPRGLGEAWSLIPMPFSSRARLRRLDAARRIDGRGTPRFPVAA